MCRSQFSLYSPQRCSAASFVTPYGLYGRGRSVSTVGYRSWLPYTDDDDA